jgi:hypothetical protein
MQTTVLVDTNRAALLESLILLAQMVRARLSRAFGDDHELRPGVLQPDRQDRLVRR